MTISLLARKRLMLAIALRTLSETSRICVIARISSSLILGPFTTSRAIISLWSLTRIIRASLFPFLASVSFCPTLISLINWTRVFFRSRSSFVVSCRIQCNLRRSASVRVEFLRRAWPTTGLWKRKTRSSRILAAREPGARSAMWIMAPRGVWEFAKRSFHSSSSLGNWTGKSSRILGSVFSDWARLIASSRLRVAGIGSKLESLMIPPRAQGLDRQPRSRVAPLPPGRSADRGAPSPP